MNIRNDKSLNRDRNVYTYILCICIYVMILHSLSETSVSLRRNVDDRERQLQAKRLDHLRGLLVDVQNTLSVNQVQSGNIWNVLVLSLSLLLLKLERDTSNWTLLDSLHQMGSVTCDLVSQSLGLDSGDLIAESLVGLEIQSKLWIVTLNQSLGGTLDGLSSNSTLNKLRKKSKKARTL